MTEPLLQLLRTNSTVDEVRKFVEEHPASVATESAVTGRLPLFDFLESELESVFWVDETDVFNKLQVLVEAYPASLEKVDEKGRTPLHFVAGYTGGMEETYTEILMYVLEQYPGANAVEDKEGRLPLQWAIEHNSLSNVRLLSLEEHGFYAAGKSEALHLLLKREMMERMPPMVETLRCAKLFIPDAFKQKDDSGNLYIHSLLSSRRSSTATDSVQHCVEAYPLSVRVRGEAGDLPLHMAIKYMAEDSIIEAFFRRYPEAASEKDSDGSLPIHLLLKHHYADFSEVLDQIHSANPQAVNTVTDEGWTILHCACSNEECADKMVAWAIDKNPSCFRTADLSGKLPLHIAAYHDSYGDSSLLQSLVDRFPGGIQVKDQDGDLPLVSALRQPSSIFSAKSTKIRFLLDAYPGAVYVANNNGQLALHVACAFQYPEVIDLVTKYNTGALSVFDNAGMLPFHYACTRAAVSGWDSLRVSDLSIVEHLIKKVNGDSAGLPATKDGSPALFLACENEKSLDIVSTLVKQSPELFSLGD